MIHFLVPGVLLVWAAFAAVLGGGPILTAVGLVAVLVAIAVQAPVEIRVMREGHDCSR